MLVRVFPFQRGGKIISCMLLIIHIDWVNLKKFFGYTLIIMELLLNEASENTWLFIKQEAIKGKEGSKRSIG